MPFNENRVVGYQYIQHLGLCFLAAPAIFRVEVGVMSGTGGLIRPYLKPTPCGPQGFAQLNDSHPGGVAQSGPRGGGWNVFMIPI